MNTDRKVVDAIMSQIWYYDDPMFNGIYIMYTNDDGDDVKCGILSPNPNFKYPEVYQGLCKRICDEHNRCLVSDKKMTKKIRDAMFKSHFEEGDE